jgi:hypothetical protein
MKNGTTSTPGASPRVALVELPEGGLLLETSGGMVYSLNRSATSIWKAHLEGEGNEAIAANLAARHGMTQDIALQDVEEALLPPSDYVQPWPSDFRYERRSDGYAFSYRGDVAFEIEEHGTTLRAGDLIRARPAMAQQLLLAVVPKILALRGYLVLHASAVEVGETVVAFAGPSGAGKTTTARALVDIGARPVSEDKVLLTFDATGNVLAYLEGEGTLLRWVDQIRSQVMSNQEVACAPLCELIERSPTMKLEQIGVLDALRRHQGSLAMRPLSSPEAASVVFNNSFLGCDDPSTWIEQLEASASVASNVAVSEMTMPTGLAALRTAARALLARPLLWPAKIPAR